MVVAEGLVTLHCHIGIHKPSKLNTFLRGPSSARCAEGQAKGTWSLKIATPVRGKGQYSEMDMILCVRDAREWGLKNPLVVGAEEQASIRLAGTRQTGSPVMSSQAPQASLAFIQRGRFLK